MRLMSQLCLKREVWIPTAAAEGTRRARPSRAAKRGRRYAAAPAAVTQRQPLLQPQTPQSAQVERAVRQVPSRSVAAVGAGVSPPVYMSCTHYHPLLGRGTAPSMPGGWNDAELQVGGGGGMRGHSHSSAYDQGERFERWESQQPRGEEEESWARFYFKVVVVLLAVVGVLWWMW